MARFASDLIVDLFSAENLMAVAAVNAHVAAVIAPTLDEHTEEPALALDHTDSINDYGLDDVVSAPVATLFHFAAPAQSLTYCPDEEAKLRIKLSEKEADKLLDKLAA